MQGRARSKVGAFFKKGSLEIKQSSYNRVYININTSNIISQGLYTFPFSTCGSMRGSQAPTLVL